MKKYSKTFSSKPFFLIALICLFFSCKQNNADAIDTFYKKTLNLFNNNPNIVSYPMDKELTIKKYLGLCIDSLNIGSIDSGKIFEMRIWGNFFGLARQQKLTQIIIKDKNIDVAYHSFRINWDRKSESIHFERNTSDIKTNFIKQTQFLDGLSKIQIPFLFDSTKKASYNNYPDGDDYIIELKLHDKIYYSLMNNPIDNGDFKRRVASKELVSLINFLNKEINSDYH